MWRISLSINVEERLKYSNKLKLVWEPQFREV